MFIDFKKAFDRVWHEALWAIMKKFNISVIDAIQSLYENAMSAVLVQGATTPQPSSTSRLHLEDIRTHALENYNGTIIIGGSKDHKPPFCR